MSTTSTGPLGSIAIAPNANYYFANSILGDIILRGTGNPTPGGAQTQKILLGTVPDNTRDASLSLTASNMRAYVQKFSLSNDAGEAYFSTSYSNVGLNKLNPTATLDVQGTGVFSDTLLVKNATTLSNGLTVYNNVTFSSNLTVGTESLFGGNMICSSNVTILGSLDVTTVKSKPHVLL